MKNCATIIISCDGRSDNTPARLSGIDNKIGPTTDAPNKPTDDASFQPAMPMASINNT